ncbi:MAG: PhoU family protein [Chloroflexi bacterium]|nr:PhoU family protein [Chloroflexota bacterium]
MTRANLDSKLQNLLNEILELDSMVETATLQSIEALKNHDLELAKQIYHDDALINARRFDLENDCMITIATQQPIVAHDLRLVASILEVVAELERMGDYAKGIAKIALQIGTQPHIKPLIDIPRMAEIAVSMLHRSVMAFVHFDAEAARQIPDEDDQVDFLYKQVYRELVSIMFSNPSTIDQANYLMWVAHNLERMADRVTNICERAIYVATGQMKEIDVSDDESKV